MGSSESEAVLAIDRSVRCSSWGQTSSELLAGVESGVSLVTVAVLLISAQVSAELASLVSTVNV
jgi:hypothetical protein